MSRPFRWLPVQQARHAIADTFPFWGEKTTLCGMDVVIDHRPTEREWGWPTCQICQTAWRAAEVHA
jgi:hypothetical protein